MLGGKKILVAGGAGFVGSFLCETLLQRGHEVICIDNHSTGLTENIAHIIGRKSFTSRRHDVTVPMHYEVDEIYNLACPASPVHYQADPVHTLMTSVVGTMNLLTNAQKVGAKIFQASTSEVYGDPTVHPQSEGYWGNVNPIGIRACYDEGKRCAETMLFDYHRCRGVNIRVARIFNTYGPRMQPNDGRVVSNFIVQALRGEPLTLYGNGLQTRSFCYVTDLVDGIVRLMDAPDEVTGPVNLGNPVEFTVRELAELVIELTGSRSRPVFKPLPQDDPKQRKPDISTAMAALDWQPRVPLRQGLQLTIDYFEDRLMSKADVPWHAVANARHLMAGQAAGHYDTID
ncbi:MAG: UDP-glucuronic acid decarboxylase family protein [Paracoccaceae bacterium]